MLKEGMINVTQPGDLLNTWFDIETDGKQDEFCARTLVTQDYVPTLTEMEMIRMQGSGWTKNRTMRLLGKIPLLAMKNAADEGYDMDNQQDIRRWFRDHPEFCVDHGRVRPHNQHIIIK